MLEQMQRPSSRSEFERAFHITEEQMRLGKIMFANNLSEYINGIRRVRMLPNGRIDFNSVNEFARLHANNTAHMAQAFANGELKLPRRQSLTKEQERSNEVNDLQPEVDLQSEVSPKTRSRRKGQTSDQVSRSKQPKSKPPRRAVKKTDKARPKVASQKKVNEEKVAKSSPKGRSANDGGKTAQENASRRKGKRRQ